MPIARYLYIGLVTVAVLLVAVGVALVAAPSWTIRAYFATLYISGRAGGCSLREALNSLELRAPFQEQANRFIGKDHEGFEEWDTPLGRFWNPPGNPLHFLVAEQRSDVYAIPECRVEPGDVVLDCGANVGTFTRKALQAGAKLVVAIELEPRNYSCLRRNFEREIRDGRVIVVTKGVWDKDDTLRFYAYHNAALGSVVMTDRPQSGETRPKEIMLPLTTIDRIVGELKLRTVDFIKMDVEGAEQNALRGAVETIRRHRPRMAIAVENLAEDIVTVPTVVRGIGSGYRERIGCCRWYDESSLRPEVVFFY